MDTNYNVKLLILIEIIKNFLIEVISILKKILPTKFKTFLKKFRKFNSINNLDKKLLKYLNFKDGFYIECGANDGVNQSVTWYFERALKWRGLLIEPIKEIFEELKKNRNKNNFFFNTALGSYKCKKKITLHIDENDFLTTRSTLDNKKREKISVSCDNLTNILDKIKAPKIIDFFVLDVEGDELKILEGINFKKYKFKFILIESGNFSKLNQILKNNKYMFIKKLYKGGVYNDYLFKFKNNKELII